MNILRRARVSERVRKSVHERAYAHESLIKHGRAQGNATAEDEEVV